MQNTIFVIYGIIILIPVLVGYVDSLLEFTEEDLFYIDLRKNK